MHPAKLAFLLVLLGGLTTAGAETLQLTPEQRAALENKELLVMELPARGMSMQEVEARFGAPLSKELPVGKPPIIRWEYADYTVYFEGRYVIHAVPNRK